MDPHSIYNRAASLVGDLNEGCKHTTGFSSLSTTVYDTAWVAMVTKNVHGRTRWLFPECFQYLLAQQMNDGGWDSYASEVDGILNTMAALLALKIHADATQYLGSPLTSDIETRIFKGSTALQKMLDKWDVDACEHVGFEVLVPAILRLLKNRGFSFTISKEETLMSLNHRKIGNFDPSILYGQTCTTQMHSLEAFVDRIDFDRVGHHKVGGSMMGSPASTAAYLIHVSSWDDEAERYLSAVISSAKDGEYGGVPSAFPTTTFMLCWAASTLLSSGFTIEDLGLNNMHSIADFLERELDEGDGLVGFAPGILQDADDTAKTILTLNLIGRPALPDRMITAFENETHFKTFETERNPSFSANCNILNALLSVPAPNKYKDQIRKATIFLCEMWYQGDTKDKWNISDLYSWMLLSQALTRLLFLWDTGDIEKAFEDVIRDKVLVVLTEIFVRTLQELEAPQCSEVTGYAVLTLTCLASLPWLDFFRSEISQATEKSQQFIRDTLYTPVGPDYLWIEKITYSSSTLRQAYCLAALKAKPSYQIWGDAVRNLADIPTKKLAQFSCFFGDLPLFKGTPQWRLQASIVEGYLFYPQLERMSLTIFSRKYMTKDEYLEYIPLTWVACNTKRTSPLSANILWDMMVISMLNFQVDEYMEAVVGKEFAHNLGSVKRLVYSLREEDNAVSNTFSEQPISATSGDESIGREKTLCLSDCDVAQKAPNGRFRTETKSNVLRDQAVMSVQFANESSSGLLEVSQTLSQFFKYVLTHPHIIHASPTDRTNLSKEVRAYLLAHITQIEYNQQLSSQEPSPGSLDRTPILQNSGSSYFTWVHTTSAVHTSCPYSFALIACLTGSALGRGDCFLGVQQKYLAQALVRSLAAMCRQYNDYGSILRDRAEGNVNSVNFPEFHEVLPVKRFNVSGADLSEGEHVRGPGEGVKQALVEIAEFERQSLNLTMAKLQMLVEKKVADVLGLFVDVTDLHGQIYMARDIASRIQ